MKKCYKLHTKLRLEAKKISHINCLILVNAQCPECSKVWKETCCCPACSGRLLTYAMRQDDRRFDTMIDAFHGKFGAEIQKSMHKNLHKLTKQN